ncbi:hypothetical protein BC936DRAFT_137854 [Jimgerdemannia flammicorona]|uniref:Ion transport domain-containing protein n=1 Tax=Jimgerdemannia flammicorona TaxID=994334 RepID=A0A433CWJ0_9FUNG|nr:hypothetical protein BC936DRAFT_137854 [Jimgerdemannia flammicorona]
MTENQDVLSHIDATEDPKQIAQDDSSSGHISISIIPQDLPVSDPNLARADDISIEEMQSETLSTDARDDTSIEEMQSETLSTDTRDDISILSIADVAFGDKPVGNYKPRATALSPDHKLLATFSNEGELAIWNFDPITLGVGSKVWWAWVQPVNQGWLCDISFPKGATHVALASMAMRYNFHEKNLKKGYVWSLDINGEPPASSESYSLPILESDNYLFAFNARDDRKNQLLIVSEYAFALTSLNSLESLMTNDRISDDRVSWTQFACDYFHRDNQLRLLKSRCHLQEMYIGLEGRAIRYTSIHNGTDNWFWSPQDLNHPSFGTAVSCDNSVLAISSGTSLITYRVANMIMLARVSLDQLSNLGPYDIQFTSSGVLAFVEWNSRRLLRVYEPHTLSTLWEVEKDGHNKFCIMLDNGCVAYSSDDDGIAVSRLWSRWTPRSFPRLAATESVPEAPVYGEHRSMSLLKWLLTNTSDGGGQPSSQRVIADTSDGTNTFTDLDCLEICSTAHSIEVRDSTSHEVIFYWVAPFRSPADSREIDVIHSYFFSVSPEYFRVKIFLRYLNEPVVREVLRTAEPGDLVDFSPNVHDSIRVLNMAMDLADNLSPAEMEQCEGFLSRFKKILRYTIDRILLFADNNPSVLTINGVLDTAMMTCVKYDMIKEVGKLMRRNWIPTLEPGKNAFALAIEYNRADIVVEMVEYCIVRAANPARPLAYLEPVVDCLESLVRPEYAFLVDHIAPFMCYYPVVVSPFAPPGAPKLQLRSKRRNFEPCAIDPGRKDKTVRTQFRDAVAKGNQFKHEATLCVVPLKGLNSYKEQMGLKPRSVFSKIVLHRELFIETSLMYPIVAQKWNSFGRWFFGFIFFLKALLMVSFSIIASEENRQMQNFFAYTTVVLTAFFLLQEARQMVGSAANYLRSPFNYIDWLAFSFLFASALMIIRHLMPPTWLLSVGVIFMWLNLIMELRVFSGFGIMIASVLETVSKARWLLLLLAFVNLGFSHCLFLLFSHSTEITPDDDNASNNFETFGTSVVSILFLLTGDPGNFGGLTSVPVYILRILFSLLTAILLLNVLIALLNNVYTDTTKIGERVWLRQKAQWIAEVEVYWMLPSWRQKEDWFPDYIYYEADLKEYTKWHEEHKISQLNHGRFNIQKWPLKYEIEPPSMGSDNFMTTDANAFEDGADDSSNAEMAGRTGGSESMDELLAVVKELSARTARMEELLSRQIGNSGTQGG